MKYSGSHMLRLGQKILLATLFVVLSWCARVVSAADAPVGAAGSDSYYLQGGDVIELLVWKEPDLTREMLIGPDGFISVPLIGLVEAKNKTLDGLRSEVKNRLSAFVNEPNINISLRGASGNKIFILGKVARPGEYPLSQPVDILQALSKAGGFTPFADPADIKIIRRQQGAQTVIKFNYLQVERGKNLEQNITLVSGDTVLVP